MLNSRTLSLLCFGLVLSLLPLHRADAQWQQGASITGTVNSITSDGTNLYLSTDTSGLFRSADHGATWEAVNDGLPDKAIAAVRANGSKLYAALKNGFSGAIFLSSNHGTTWVAPTSPYFGFVFCLEPMGTSMLAGTWYGVSKSSDAGETWSTLSTTGLPSNAGVAALATSGSTIWAGVSTSSTGGTGVFLSTNGGAKWTAKNTGLGSALPTALAMTSAAVFTGTSEGLYRSIDNGSHWTLVNGAPATGTVYSLVATGNTLFAATASGLFSSTDAGDTWIDVRLNIPTGSIVKSLSIANNELLAGAEGTLWRRPLGEVAGVAAEARNTLGLTVWPNPSSGVIHILLDQSVDTTPILTITDLLGHQLPCQIMHTGDHTLTITLDQLPKGTYFLSFQDGDVLQTQRISIE